MKNKEKIESMFGKYTDTEISKALGVTRQYVYNYRRSLGIKKLSKWDRFRGLLGVKPDREIAEIMGISTNAVVRKRIRDGVDPCGKSKEMLFQKEFVKTLHKPLEYVRTPYGIIDVLSDDAIYELKTPLVLSEAHRAVGQLLLYRNHYKNRRLVIVTNDLQINAESQDAIKRLGIEILHLSIEI